MSIEFEIALRIAAALFAGLVVGFERQLRGHVAGIRTHALISVGAATFTIVGAYGFIDSDGLPLDRTRMAAQVVSGIGFVGAGAIMREGLTVRGLTTAASLWATAAIGVALGAGMYWVATVAALAALFILVVLRVMRKWVDGLGWSHVTVVARYVSGEGTLRPLLATLNEVEAKLGEISIEDREDPEPERRVEMAVSVMTSSRADLIAALQVLSDERSEIRAIEVAD